jgi:Uma2 family endonuclease
LKRDALREERIMAIALDLQTAKTSDGQRFLLSGVSWQTYDSLLKALGDRRIRLTYDRGNLELMTLSFRHERFGRLLGRMIDTLTLELDLPVQGGKSTTFRREDLDRGLEPDECFYLANQPRIQGKQEIDLTVDPPPDLAIEVDITRSSLDRMGIYVALGVPELWRFDGRSLQVFGLRADGTYAPLASSPGFPFLPMADVARFLSEGATSDETPWIRSFRDWVRAEVAPHAPGAAGAP